MSQNKRSATVFQGVEYGGAYFSTITSDEIGASVGPGEVGLHSITLPSEAVDLIKANKAVRILEDGRCEEIEGERVGLIIFGSCKANRPVLR